MAWRFFGSVYRRLVALIRRSYEVARLTAVTTKRVVIPLPAARVVVAIGLPVWSAEAKVKENDNSVVGRSTGGTGL